MIAEYFHRILAVQMETNEELKLLTSCIKKVRQPTISNDQASLIEKPLSKEELAMAIDLLKNKKSPSKDGVPAEFSQTFKDILLQPLMEVWTKASPFKTRLVIGHFYVLLTKQFLGIFVEDDNLVF